MKSKKKAFVGMSGGVDSSVSAALLKQQGYDVTGVFIKVWQPNFLPCSWKEDRRDAMRVCAHLNIPFMTLDLEKEYKKEVVDYMIAEYKKGKTPNPDVMCNKYVKFGGFFDYAMKEKADYVATGHYARNRIEGVGNRKLEKTKFKLLKGKDSNKDQSYFLWTLTQKQLDQTLFPVGSLPKPEVRKLAKRFKLPNAKKKDSQGLCFVGKIDMKEFLAHYIKYKPGNVLNEKGQIIGTHNGALFYTIGERHGFFVTSKSPADRPLFVVSKNISRNTITVSDSINAKFQLNQKASTRIINTNWISGIPVQNKIYQAQVRYRDKSHDVKIKVKDGKKAEIIFTKKRELVTSGQSAVIYDGEECIGGGVII